MVVGTKLQVWNGTADKTAGGLRKSDLAKVRGKIVSIKQHNHGVKMAKHIGVKSKVGLIKKGKNGQKASGIFSSILGSVGLGVPASRGGRKRRARRSKGGLLDKTRADLAPLTDGFNALKRMPKNLASDVSDMFKSLDPMNLLMGKGVPKTRGGKKKARKSKGKGVPTSRGGKRGRPRKQRGKGIFDDIMNGVSRGVDIGTKILPFVL